MPTISEHQWLIHSVLLTAEDNMDYFMHPYPIDPDDDNIPILHTYYLQVVSTQHSHEQVVFPFISHLTNHHLSLITSYSIVDLSINYSFIFVPHPHPHIFYDFIKISTIALILSTIYQTYLYITMV
jgi:hypothetical protein